MTENKATPVRFKKQWRGREDQLSLGGGRVGGVGYWCFPQARGWTAWARRCGPEMSIVPTHVGVNRGTPAIRWSNFIIPGVLNADWSYYDEENISPSLKNPDYNWLISNSMDTNLSSTACTYDRMIMTSTTASYYTGEAGVFRFDQNYGITSSEAAKVSDHYPVYASFFSCIDCEKAPGETGQDGGSVGCYIKSCDFIRE